MNTNGNAKNVSLLVELTKDQCVNLAEFIDLYLLTAIREDEFIDNLAWVESMILAKKELEHTVKLSE